jgi:hypothetical protein
MNLALMIEMSKDGKTVYLRNADSTLDEDLTPEALKLIFSGDIGEGHERLSHFIHKPFDQVWSYAKLTGDDKHFGISAPHAGRGCPENFFLPTDERSQCTWFTDDEMLNLDLTDIPTLRRKCFMSTEDYDFTKSLDENFPSKKTVNVGIGRFWTVEDWLSSGRTPSMYDYIIVDNVEHTSELENFKSYVQNLRLTHPGAAFRFIVFY